MDKQKIREELIEGMECDDLCFMETKKDVKQEAEEEHAKKQCPPCSDTLESVYE